MVEHINTVPRPPEPEPPGPFPDRQVPDPEREPWNEPDEEQDKVGLPPNVPGIGVPVRTPDSPFLPV